MFGRKLDRPWLFPSGTAEGHFRVHKSKITCSAAFCSGTGLRSRNFQTCTTRFRISELENLVQIFRYFRYGVSVRLTNLSHFGTGKPSSIFSTLSIWDFSTADKSFVLGQLLKLVDGGKNNVHSNRDFLRTGDHS